MSTSLERTRRFLSGGVAKSCLLVVVFAAGCDRSLPPTEPPPAPPLDVELRQAMAQWGVLPILGIPPQNPALVQLGQALMFDKILSGNRDVSCATCHAPLMHGGDGLSLAVGTGGAGEGVHRRPGEGRQFLSRNAPSLLNQGLGAFYLFWDGRLSEGPPGAFTTPPGITLPSGLSSVLAVQAMLPVASREEMRGMAGDRDRFGNPNELAELSDDDLVQIWRGVMRRLLAIPEYVTMFNAAFPPTPTGQLGFQHAATAMAAFQVQAFTKANSRFDRYLARDNAALTLPAKRGARLFFGEARCASCHFGPLLGGQSFANVGVPQHGPGQGAGAPLDFGRGAVLDFPEYRFAFRVPPLRNVELTAPYMHNGAYRTLEAVVRHYNDVPTALREYDLSQLDPALREAYHGDENTIQQILATLDFRVRQPLGLTDEQIADLVAFLESLTDPSARELGALVPASVPSGLPVRE